MMDFERLFEAVSVALRDTRSDYHVTLGELRSAAFDHPDAKVVVDGVGGLGQEMSYRGYYDDLAFEPTTEATPATEVKAACDRALSDHYTGYKGGEYRYNDRTPLWLASYGGTGSAIVHLDVREGNIHLTTRESD